MHFQLTHTKRFLLSLKLWFYIYHCQTLPPFPAPPPGRRRGWPRGGGGDLAAWDSPLRAPAGPGAAASEPTHLRPPGAGCTAPPGERERQPPHPRASLDRAGRGGEEREREASPPSAHGEHGPCTFFLLLNSLTSN